MADDTEPPTKPELPGGAIAKPRARALDARFEHVREIGRGGMGRVVEARDRQLGRIVALKESLDEFPEARLRFEREVAITARLEHPSIVPLYDAGVTADGAPFYVMRKVTGSPLDQLLRRATTLDKRLLLLPHMLAVADAIAHAHQRGVIHRDLKPHNVLVGEHGETIVIDWGLAKTIDEPDVRGEATRASGELTTTAGAVIGTPGFMAPEQVTAGKTDERSDVYALGACLYYMLSGRTPFQGSTEDEVLARTTRGELDPLDKLVPGLPPDLLTIVNKAMARDPAARYLDAGGLSVDLRRFLGGQLVASHHYPPLQRIARWVRRHRGVVAATLAGIAIAVTIAIVLLGRVFDERARTQAALEAERARSDELVISQATSYLQTDPTRAIATLQTLRADSPRWPKLGPLLADARARGIAVGYPGNGQLEAVSYAPDPKLHQVVTSGGGFVRIHDLAAHTTTNLVADRPLVRASWCGSLVLLSERAAQGAAPALYDPRTKVKEPITWSATVNQVHAADGVVVFIDGDRRVVSLDVKHLPISAKPAVIAGANDATWLHLSRSGKTLVVLHEASAQVFRRDGDWKLVFEVPYVITAYAVDERDERIALQYYATPDFAFVMEHGSNGKELRKWDLGGASLGIHYIGQTLYALRGVEVLALGEKGTLSSVTRVDSMMGLQGVGDFVATLETPRRIVIRAQGFKRTILSPIDLNGIAGDPHGRYLIGLGMEALLNWDLAFVLPRRATVDWAESIAFVDENTLVGSANDFQHASRRVERYLLGEPFGIERAEHLGNVTVMSEMTVIENGLVTILERLANRERSFNEYLRQLQDITTIAAVDAASVLIARTDGSISRVVLATGARTQVAKVDGDVVALVANGDSFVAQTHTGEVWRGDKQGVERALLRSTIVGVAMAADGTTYYARNSELVAWPRGREAQVATALPHLVATLRKVAGDRIAIQTKDNALHLYEPATRTTRVVFNAANTPAMIAPPFSANGMLTAAQPTRGLAVIRLDGGDPWSIAEYIDAQAMAISPSAKSLVVSLVPANPPYGPWTLMRFDTTLPVPTLAWVRSATNARPPASPLAAIEWAKLPSQ